MAVAKKCDLCNTYYEALPENSYKYEEDGEEYIVNSFRLGNWNAKTKSWDSIVSGYDLCRKCGKAFTELIFELNPDIKTRKKIEYKKVQKETTDES